MIKSPGTKPVKKQQTEESTDLKPPTSMFRRQLQFSKTPLVELPKTDVQPYRNIQPKPCTPSLSALSVIEVQSFQSVAKPHLTTPTMTSREIEHMSVYDKKFDDVVTKSISTSQQNNLLRAVNTKQPHAIANVISKECPSIVLAVKRISLKSIENTCCGLLRRKENCSVLYGNTYDKLKDFAFENVWEEMKKNQYFIDVLNTVSGVTATTDSNISHDYKVKYSFVYSILMNIRWHELSLLQRLNTILLIEGGCSKQVHIYYILYIVNNFNTINDHFRTTFE